jgi:hypothetical protein
MVASFVGVQLLLVLLFLTLTLTQGVLVWRS